MMFLLLVFLLSTLSALLIAITRKRLRSFKFWAVAFGCITTILGGTYFIFDLIGSLFPHYSVPPLENCGILFTKEQVDVTLETVKILFPTVCGYTIFIAPSIKYLKDNNLFIDRTIAITTSITLVLAVGSIGLWSGALSFLIRVSGYTHPGNRDFQFYEISFDYALFLCRTAHIAFFLSICWFITSSVLVLTLRTNSPN